MRIGVFAAIFLTASILNAQTVINAITDAASFSPRVSPGALATIFGSHLSSNTAQADSFPLPLSLGGASVYAAQSSQNPIQAPLVYASPTQINFQVPSGLTAGTANFSVTVGGGNSLSFTVNVVSAGPSIFQDTSNHAIAQDAGAGYATNSDTHPAAASSVVVVYLTGLGAVDHPVPDGAATPGSPLANATGTPSATIGGMNAPVQFLGLTPGYAGLAQANIQVPSLATGDYPLVITVGGYVSASAMLSVSGSGTAPPSFLSLLGQVPFANSSVSSVAINGNTTYVCGANRIYIINTSNVSAPAVLGEFGDADLAGNGGVCVLNQTVGPILVDLVGPGGSPTFVVYNVATPTQPIKLGQIAPQSYTYLTDLSFIGTAGFASTSWFQVDSASNITAQHGDLLAFDLSAELPQLISAMVPNAAVPASNNLNVRPNALALPASSNYPNTVYSASTTATGNSTKGNAALDVIDVSNPQNMQGVVRVTVSSAAIFLGFAYDNNLLFLTGNTTGFRNPGVPDFSITGDLTLTTMNIGNVRNPVPIKTVVTGIQTTGTYHMAPFGSSVFAIVNNPPASDLSGPGSLMIVDARNTSAPVLYPFMTQFGLSGLAAVNNFLLVPNQNGMNIYKIQIP
jgi:uncharacterized protein (TIGR03437 family)